MRRLRGSRARAQTIRSKLRDTVLVYLSLVSGLLILAIVSGVVARLVKQSPQLKSGVLDAEEILPIFIVHFRLPKAHVQAPVSGPIVLARLLLKI